MMRKLARASLAGLAVAVLLAWTALSADWPTYRRDAARTGASAENLKLPLARQWVYRTVQPPAPAWPEPGKELHRVDFDYAFQPVAAGGLVYFASSSDDTVRALNARTGELAWRFVTRGPVRFAPSIAHGKAYFVSDDGNLYCLDAKTGKPVWIFRAAPDEDSILGNGRMISRYPCRSGALVVDDVVYVTAGMWPTEGVCVYALDAETGRELWCNDSSGSIYIDLPHAGASGFSGVAPQGYMVASGRFLLVTTGRSIPAAFDRRTGRLLHYKPEKTHYHGAAYGGGVWCAAAGDLYFNTKNRFHNPSEAHIGEAEPCAQDGMIAYSLVSGDQEFHIPGKYRVLATGDTVYAAGGRAIDAINLNALRRKRRIRSEDVRWSAPHPERVYCMAMAGRTVFTGNRGSIRAFDAESGKPVWQATLDKQQVRGLAVSDGRLIAATHTGAVICFGAEETPGARHRLIKEQATLTAISEAHQDAARDVVSQSGKTEGYALVIGERDCRLGEALAMQTQLHVIGALSDDAEARAERERLLDAGTLGFRVAVHVFEEPKRLRLPTYFADLVVISGKAKGASPQECYRALRPCGGVLCFVGMDAAAKREFVGNAGVPPAEVDKNARRVVRGSLPGAGQWGYPWADGGRRGIGSESRVRFPLELLWFGGPGPGALVDRHLMGSPPVSANGRVFMQGQNHVISFDAFNGRELWQRHFEEVGRKYSQYYSSSIVADTDGVYVVHRDRCIRLDQATGKTLREYAIPKSVLERIGPPAVPEYVDVEWPDTWKVIGPFPKGKPPLSADALRTIPERIAVSGKEYVASELEAANGALDFAVLFGGYGFEPLPPGRKPPARPRRGKAFGYHEVGRICYALAEIDCPRAGILLIGAGADWGMQWYLDGEAVFDALRGGRIGTQRGYFDRKPCSPRDCLFDVDVEAGKHVLGVMVTAGSRGWALASGSMAKSAEELMPVATGANPNVPNLRDLVWGYLSVTGNLLLGSCNVPIAPGQPAESHLVWRSESKALFALNKEDGSLRWTYRPKPDRIVSNIEIAFGDGRLFLIDGTSKADLVKARRRSREIKADLTLVALDLESGAETWRQDDVPMLGDRSALTRLNTNISHLLMGQPSWGHLVYADGVVVYGANAAYDAATGRKLWQNTAPPGKLPIVYGDRIITSSCALELRTGRQCMTEDVLTGQEAPWRYSRAYGCGPIAGCRHMLFFRSGADGFFDMECEGSTNFGGVRSGCSRTLLAANGLLIHPQGYSGCCCSYNFKTNLALISAAERHDTWYVLPRRAVEGPVNRLAVNFGAPGDRKDARRSAWLGLPRPMLRTACPAPVAVSMDNAACIYRRRSTSAIKGTDSPWVYSSALCGSGQIAVGLHLRPDVPLPERAAGPAIDGKLTDPCWSDVPAVPLENSPFTMLAAAVDLRMFRDAENVYLGYRCASAVRGEASTGSIDVYLADYAKRVGIHLVIASGGKATATFGTVDRSRRIDPKWKGEWRHALHETADGWTAEAALPIKTLEQCGMSLKRLQLNCMAQRQSQLGWEAVFLTDPSYGTKFKNCVGFQRVSIAPPEPAPERTFTLRLHFAEVEDVKPGARVFDVSVQGRRVLEGLDVVAEAGRNRSVVKEFKGVKGTDRILIELSPKPQASLPPAICGLEVIAD